MGIEHQRPSTKGQQEAKQQQQDFLDTQDLAANLFEQGLVKDQAILDLQELVVQLFEGRVE